MISNKKYLVGTIHIQQEGVIMDGALPLKTYIELMHLLFPDETIENIIMENTMVAPNPDAIVFELQLINGKVPKPQPELLKSILESGIELPWITVDFMNNWRTFLNPIEIKLYNIVE